jgi:nicotinamidase-related amidase
MLLERAKSLLLLVDMQERLVPAMANAADVTDRCGILLRAAYELGVPIFASEQYPKGLGATLPPLAEFATRRLEKVEFSAYANPAIRDELKREGEAGSSIGARSGRRGEELTDSVPFTPVSAHREEERDRSDREHEDERAPAEVTP